MSKRSNPGNKSSFQQFQESTNDAWSDGDDDLLVGLKLKLETGLAVVTADQVIRNHRPTGTSTPPVAVSNHPNHTGLQNVPTFRYISLRSTKMLVLS